MIGALYRRIGPVSRDREEQDVNMFVAFLRAVNVGGRRVVNSQLMTAFADARIRNVRPFLASGNIRFEAAVGDSLKLEAALEQRLEATLGFAVEAFIRTQDEVCAIAQCLPFDEATVAAATAFNIGLLKVPLTPDQHLQLVEFTSEVDRFEVVDREVYWLCQVKQSESRFSNVRLEKALDIRTTFRNRNTLRRLATLK